MGRRKLRKRKKNREAKERERWRGRGRTGKKTEGLKMGKKQRKYGWAADRKKNMRGN